MAKWVAALIVLFPVTVHQLDYRSRFTSGMSLHLQRTSPAYAALEDSTESYDERTDHIQVNEVIRLKAGTIRLRQPFSQQQQPRRMILSGMVIKQNFRPRAPLQADMDLRMETPRTGLLPLEERKRILAQYFRTQDWSAPSVKEAARKLILDEIAANPPNPNARVLVGSDTHTPIVVAKPGTDLTGLLHGHSKSVAYALPPSGPPTTSPPDFRQPGIAMLSDPPQKPAPEYPSLSVSSYDGSRTDPHVLKGQLQIKDGLAFMGEETYFTLHRVNEGSIFETGRVWVSEARFEIYVKEPRGQLIAELHSRGGQTMGRGILDLDSASDGDPLRIELSPVTSGAAVRVISGYSDGPRAIPVKNAIIAMDQGAIPQPMSAESVISDPERSHHSTYVVQAQAAQHWPTTAMGIEGRQQDIRLFPESLVKSLLDLAIPSTQRKDAEQFGVVWGRVVKDGKPVSDVEVELAGDYSPVYFNKLYLPDHTRSSTDTNGTFAFLTVRPGVQAVRIKYKDKTYPAQVFPADVRHVSYVEIHLEANRSVNVALEDAFDLNKSLSAHVRFVGVDEEVEVNEMQKLHYPGGPDVMVMEADAGSEYELSRAQVLKNQTHVTVPLIRRDWLQTIITIKQITLIPRRGTVIGFVADQPFKVELSNLAEAPQIVYFDAMGRIAEGDSAPAGGGFILFNAPPGLQTLLVKPLTSQQVFSQSFVAEPEFIHTFKYSFGESY